MAYIVISVLLISFLAQCTWLEQNFVCRHFLVTAQIQILSYLGTNGHDAPCTQGGKTVNVHMHVHCVTIRPENSSNIFILFTFLFIFCSSKMIIKNYKKTIFQFGWNIFNISIQVQVFSFCLYSCSVKCQMCRCRMCLLHCNSHVHRHARWRNVSIRSKIRKYSYLRRN